MTSLIFNIFNVLFIGFMVSLFFCCEAGGSFLIHTCALRDGRGRRSVVPRHTASRCTPCSVEGAGLIDSVHIITNDRYSRDLSQLFDCLLPLT